MKNAGVHRTTSITNQSRNARCRVAFETTGIDYGYAPVGIPVRPGYAPVHASDRRGIADGVSRSPLSHVGTAI